MLFWTVYCFEGGGQYLVDSFNYSSHGHITRPVHRLAVICRPPAGAVDVDVIGHVSHSVSLDKVGHKRLIQHT